jgi:TatD DNase family protein
MNDYCIIDTHTHLYDSVFDEDREEVLRRAREAGVCAIITVAEELGDARRNLELAATYPLLKPAAGLYPAHLDLTAADAMIDFIRSHRQKLVAIGEVGLDYWVVKEEFPRELQREIFAKFIDLSLELDLPLNVHSRSAGRHVVAMLLEKGARRVQLHAFDGKASTAAPAVEANFFFSVPPSIIHSRQKQKLAKQLPLSCLLIETDSPVLGPVRDQRNEPANAAVVIDALAELKNITRQEVLETTYQNTCQLYGLNPPLNFSHEGIYNAVQSTKEHEENHGSQNSPGKSFGRSRNPFSKGFLAAGGINNRWI